MRAVEPPPAWPCKAVDMNAHSGGHECKAELLLRLAAVNELQRSFTSRNGTKNEGGGGGLDRSRSSASACVRD